MPVAIKKYYEAFLLLIVVLAFFLFRRNVFAVNVYLTAAAVIALYFVPVRIIASFTNIDTVQTGVKVTSSIIIAAIIGTSLLAVADKHFPGLIEIAYLLSGINIIFMIYSFFKDQERKAFLLHLIMLMLLSAVTGFI